ncbi:MAG: hypothetical protein J5863_00680, partial [Desulfovibrio sp.]|nr:hypothetical protein [Desulfovibrio sp.]
MSTFSARAGEAPENPSAAGSLEQEETALLKRELASLFAGQASLAEAFLDAQPGAGQEALYTGAARFVLERARDVSACLKECLDALALGAGMPAGAAASAEACQEIPSAQPAAAAEGEAPAGGSGTVEDQSEPAASESGLKAEPASAGPEAAVPNDAAPDAAPGAAPDAAPDAAGAAQPEAFDWRSACRAIVEGGMDADRAGLLDLLERAMACADKEGAASPEDKRLVEAASDHFTALLARGAAGAGEAGKPQAEAEPKKAPDSGAATFTVTPAGTCASGGV